MIRINEKRLESDVRHRKEHLARYLAALVTKTYGSNGSLQQRRNGVAQPSSIYRLGILIG